MGMMRCRSVCASHISSAERGTCSRLVFRVEESCPTVPAPWAIGTGGGDFRQQIAEYLLSLSCTGDVCPISQVRAHGGGEADYVRFQADFQSDFQVYFQADFQGVVNAMLIEAGHEIVGLPPGRGWSAPGILIAQPTAALTAAIEQAVCVPLVRNSLGWVTVALIPADNERFPFQRIHHRRHPRAWKLAVDGLWQCPNPLLEPAGPRYSTGTQSASDQSTTRWERGTILVAGSPKQAPRPRHEREPPSHQLCESASDLARSRVSTSNAMSSIAWPLVMATLGAAPACAYASLWSPPSM